MLAARHYLRGPLKFILASVEVLVVFGRGLNSLCMLLIQPVVVPLHVHEHDPTQGCKD